MAALSVVFGRRWRMAAAVVAVVAVSLVSGHPLPEGTGIWLASGRDKLFHGAFYMLLALLMAPEAGHRRAWWLTLLLLALSDELHQCFVPGRHGSFQDLMADLAGVALAALALRRIRGCVTC